MGFGMQAEAGLPKVELAAMASPATVRDLRVGFMGPD